MYALVFLFIALVNAFGNPGPCIGDCWTHDPGLYQRKSDGRYFRFATGDGIHISSAPSIVGPWQVDGVAMKGGSKIDHPGSTNLWVRPADDLYMRPIYTPSHSHHVPD